MFYMRSIQKLANYNKWYGETLEGNQYKAETIIVENNDERTSGSRSKSVKGVGKSKGKKVKFCTSF